MAREFDERKKRAALRKLRRAAELAARGLGPPLSDWETAFLAEVEARIERYGSAFADPSKGGRGEALSGLQQQKLKEIDRKARGKTRASARKTKGPLQHTRPPQSRPNLDFPASPPADARPGPEAAVDAIAAGPPRCGPILRPNGPHLAMSPRSVAKSRS